MTPLGPPDRSGGGKALATLSVLTGRGWGRGLLPSPSWLADGFPVEHE